MGPSNEDESSIHVEVDEESEAVPAEDDVLEAEEDQVKHYGFVGMRIKVLYDNGWFIGNIVHYNLAFSQYKVMMDRRTIYLQKISTASN